MDSNPLSSIFDRVDSNYMAEINEHEQDLNIKKKKEQRQKRVQNQKNQNQKGEGHENEKQNENDENRGDKKATKTKSFEDKKIENQFYQITNEETRRLNSLKTRRTRIDELKLMEGTGIEKTIEDEIHATLKKKNWRALDLCFKWNLINEYINSLRCKNPDLTISETDMQMIKNRVMQKMSHNVVYNREKQCIECLNFTTCMGVDI